MFLWFRSLHIICILKTSITCSHSGVKWVVYCVYQPKPRPRIFHKCPVFWTLPPPGSERDPRLSSARFLGSDSPAGRAAFCSRRRRSPKLGIQSHEHNGTLQGRGSPSGSFCALPGWEGRLRSHTPLPRRGGRARRPSRGCFCSLGDKFPETAGPARTPRRAAAVTVTVSHFYFRANANPPSMPESALS